MRKQSGHYRLRPETSFAQVLNLLCAGAKVFIKYQAQGVVG